jgi:hypothetical protein
MAFTIAEIKDHLTGMGHGGTLNKLRNINQVFERAAAAMQLRVDLLESMRETGLSQTVSNAQFDYTAPSDLGRLIDLYPQANRESVDQGARTTAQNFDLRKNLEDKTVSIESSNASKVFRINWRVRTPKTYHSMDSVTNNGTWGASGTATGVELDTIYRYTGSGSIKFDLAASGDGIQNTTATQIDLTDEDEVANVVFPVYFADASNIASVQVLWGNDLTTNYWTGVAQTAHLTTNYWTGVAQTAQSDGTAFQAGWNIISTPWNTATETGTVTPSTIDSVRVVVNTTAAGAVNNIRVDNILFAIGFPFNVKYYSKFLFKNSSDVWISRPTDNSDSVVVDNDGLLLFLYETLKVMAHQLEGTDSAFDLQFSQSELNDLYQRYKSQHPSLAVKVRQHYSREPSFRNHRRYY